MHETSSVMVDPVTRSVTSSQQAAPGWASSDASRVVAKGLGLTKAFVGQKNSFSVDCSKAGNVCCFEKSEMFFFSDFRDVLACNKVKPSHVLEYWQSNVLISTFFVYPPFFREEYAIGRS